MRVEINEPTQRMGMASLTIRLTWTAYFGRMWNTLAKFMEVMTFTIFLIDINEQQKPERIFC